MDQVWREGARAPGVQSEGCKVEAAVTRSARSLTLPPGSSPGAPHPALEHLISPSLIETPPRPDRLRIGGAGVDPEQAPAESLLGPKL